MFGCLGPYWLRFSVEVTYLREDCDFVFIYLEFCSCIFGDILFVVCIVCKCVIELWLILWRDQYIYLVYQMKRRKKSPLQYLLKAWFFMIWTLLDFGCDKWCGSNIVLGPTKATIFFFNIYFIESLILWLLLQMIALYNHTKTSIGF